MKYKYAANMPQSLLYAEQTVAAFFRQVRFPYADAVVLHPYFNESARFNQGHPSARGPGMPDQVAEKFPDGPEDKSISLPMKTGISCAISARRFSQTSLEESYGRNAGEVFRSSSGS